MVNKKVLLDTINDIEEDYGCLILQSDMEALIEKVALKYSKGVNFQNLVYRCAKELGLGDYECKVAFSYFPRNKRNEEERKSETSISWKKVLKKDREKKEKKFFNRLNQYLLPL